MIRRTFLAAALGLAATAAATTANAQTFPADITGSYTAYGMNANGTTYTGLVKIEERKSGRIAIAWRVGASAYTGIGLREDRVVTIDWGADAPVIYVIMENGELHGTWGGGRALERLVRE